MAKKSKYIGYLRVIDGMKNEGCKSVFENCDFTTVLYEIQRRKNDRIESREYITNPTDNEKLSILEKMLCYYPDNLCIKLSAAINYFETNHLRHLGLLVLRDIEEAIALNPSILTGLRNEEVFVEKIIDCKKEPEESEEPEEPAENKEARELWSARHYLNLERITSLKSDSLKLYDLLIKSYAAVLQRDDESALYYFRLIEQEHPDALFVNNLYARRLEACNFNDEAKEKRAIFSSWALHNNLTEFERVNNAMRSVYLLNNAAMPAINKTLIAVRTKSKDEISYEKDAISKAKEIIKGFDSYRVVESVHTECIDGIYYHVLRRKKGELLLCYLEDKNNQEQQLALLKNTIRFLQLLQFNMEPTALCCEKDYQEIANRLSARLEISGIKLIQMARDSINMLCNNFLSFPIVYNKDGHPENWIVERAFSGEYNYVITALDFQKKEAMPCIFDIANLLRYGDYIDNRNELILLDEYYREVKYRDAKYRDAKDKKGNFDFITYNQFLNGYYAAVVYRALSFFCAWQNPRKAGYSTRIPIVINNARNALKMTELDAACKRTLDELISSMLV